MKYEHPLCVPYLTCVRVHTRTLLRRTYLSTYVVSLLTLYLPHDQNPSKSLSENQKRKAKEQMKAFSFLYQHLIHNTTVKAPK